VKICFIVVAMMLATVLCSGVFWRVVMPRFARKQISRTLGVVLTTAFVAVSIAIPVVTYFILPEPTFLLGGLIVIAWCLAVRACTWFLGRKYVAPVLMRPDAK
jgi:hypothetical protein